MSNYPSKDNNNQGTLQCHDVVWCPQQLGCGLSVFCRAVGPADTVFYTPIPVLSLVTTKPRVPKQNFSFHILVMLWDLEELHPVVQSGGRKAGGDDQQPIRARLVAGDCNTIVPAVWHCCQVVYSLLNMLISGRIRAFSTANNVR